MYMQDLLTYTEQKLDTW